ncbi:MAG: hypothetical protein AAF556_02015 [Pseudomonadota bacterium]
MTDAKQTDAKSDTADQAADSDKKKKKKKKKPRDTSGWIQRTFFPVKDIRETAGLARNMFSAIFESRGEARQETFQEAVKRQSLSPADLLAAYKRQRGTYLLFLGISIVVVLYVLNMFLTAASVSSLMIAVLSLGPMTVLFTIAFRAAFRSWQIRHQRLGGLNEFLASWREWWPRSVTESHFSPGPSKSRAVTTKPTKARNKPAKKPTPKPTRKPT